MSSESPSSGRLPAALFWIAAGVWLLPYVNYVVRFIPPDYCATAFEGVGYYAWCLLQIGLAVGLFAVAAEQWRHEPGAGSAGAAAGFGLLVLTVLLVFVDDQWRLGVLGVAHRRVALHQQVDPLSDLFFHWRSLWHAGLVLFAFVAFVRWLVCRAQTAAARRESLVRLALVMVPPLLAGLALETAARCSLFGEPLALYKGGTEIYRFNLLLGWSHRENTVSELISPEFRVKVHLNSAGLRDREHTFEKTPSCTRILCLGDSFTFGAGVAEGQRFSDVLQRKLLTGVEAINAGVTGYGTDQEYLYLMQEGFRYKPDLVVLTFCCRNDFQDNTREAGLGYPKPRFEFEEGHLRLVSFIAPDKQTFGANPEPFSFRRHVRAYQYLVRRLYLIRETRRLGQQTASAALSHPTQASLPPSSPTDDMGWLNADSYAVRPAGFEVTGALLTAIRDECKQRGVSLVVLLAPPRELTWPAPDPMTDVWLNLARSHRAARDLCASLAVAWVDPLAAESRATRLGEETRYPTDGHWSPRGHELAANLLVRTIRQEKLLPERCLR